MDLFGFDPVGADFMSSAEERSRLIGQGPLAMAIYWQGLRPFVRADGRVMALSYYRLAWVLRYAVNPKGGRPKASPSPRQLRTELDGLERVGFGQARTRLQPRTEGASNLASVWGRGRFGP
ncbi:hypothetical protein FSC37_09230 [Piscinibacter aquaticus]|uniref:Uncharacterized protein n=1 Tax=Piscinibacter aquaticus TaxID=392597 RepID=A0A5C6U260_9BURK|nr:hypothetical protein FSC37_09230 [Piscinibacter aquaticus]